MATSPTPPPDIQHPEDAIKFLCMLQSDVSAEVFEYRHAADCFCGERQHLVDTGLWQNEGRSLEFIERAVREAILKHGVQITNDTDNI